MIGTNVQTFLFVAVTGLAVLAMATFLIFSGKTDASVFNTLAGALIGGVVGLLAPSPTVKAGQP